MPSFADYQPSQARERAPVTIRRATAADVGVVEEVQRRAGRQAHSDAYLRAVADRDRCVVVAERLASDGGSILVGWAQTYHHTAVIDAAPTGHYLGGVTVDPSSRRRGIALALTRARIEWIAARADDAFYVVNPGNLASIELHRRWSFEEVTRAPRLTGVDFSGGIGILMRAVLHQRADATDKD